MRAIRIHEGDNVAVVLQPTEKDAILDVAGITIQARDNIPVGHKIALDTIKKDKEIIKYGKVIGLASSDILTGQHVHCHNVLDITEQLCNQFAKKFRERGSDI